MLHAICDFCGKDCRDTANLLTITPFQNFARSHKTHTPYGHQDETKSFVICQACMKKHAMPNPHMDYITEDVKYADALDNKQVRLSGVKATHIEWDAPDDIIETLPSVVRIPVEIADRYHNGDEKAIPSFLIKTTGYGYLNYFIENTMD